MDERSACLCAPLAGAFTIGVSLQAVPLPTPEALLKISNRGHLASTTDTIRAVQAECFQQVNLAVAQPKLDFEAMGSTVFSRT